MSSNSGEPLSSSTLPFTHRCRTSATAESAFCRVVFQCCPRLAMPRRGPVAKTCLPWAVGETAFTVSWHRFVSDGVAGVEPVSPDDQSGALPQSFLTMPLFRNHVRNRSRLTQRCHIRRWTDSINSACFLKTPMGVEPIIAVLQTAATPRDFSVIDSVSLPGVEPGPRPSQSRMPPLHLKDIFVAS